MLNPLYTAEINGHRLRFFKNPDGTQDMPWHAFYDLLMITNHSNREAKQMLAATRGGPFKAKVRTIATSEGPVVIAPHWAAQGMIGAMLEIGRITPDIEAAYIKAGAHVIGLMVAHLPPVLRAETAISMARASAEAGEAMTGH